MGLARVYPAVVQFPRGTGRVAVAKLKPQWCQKGGEEETDDSLSDCTYFVRFK